VFLDYTPSGLKTLSQMTLYCIEEYLVDGTSCVLSRLLQVPLDMSKETF
jgi:hypothetical protein